MLPISDADVIRQRKPTITVFLIAINALVFIYELMLGSVDHARFFYQWGLIPVELSSGTEYTLLFTGYLDPLDITSYVPTWGTVFTSMFIHGGWLHFLGNMLYLWVFGRSIEDRLGYFWYIVLYLSGGVAASLTQVAINSDSQTPMVGASGAIAGVLGAYVLTYPFSRIRTLITAYFITFVRLPAVMVLGFWFVMQLFSGMWSLGPVSQGGGVAYWAHIGGFVAGVIFVAAFKIVYHQPLFPRRPRHYGWG